MPVAIRGLLSLFVLCLISYGCHSPAVIPNDTGATGLVPRPAVDALDRATANSREQRVSNLRYSATIDIASDADKFAGAVQIEFDLSDATMDLTLDFTGGTVLETVLNGQALTPAYNGFFVTLPAASLKLGPNSLRVSYQRPFGHDGTGLHRFEDSEDGRTYMHSYLWPYYANRVIPSFDQPGLKATFNLQVIAPTGWEVVSTMPGLAAAHTAGTRLWTFTETPKISTYYFSLHAGPYHIWSDNTGDVPLRLMARQSLAKYVAAEEWLGITQNGMTYFQDYFDIPYPFEKYDQLIVPEFNIGGMENAAAVTYTESYVQRQPSNRAQRERRAGTILHELAHMWFGDLVTHDWWNGMWLNESFATQMASLALAETTDFGDQWHKFFTDSKTAAYALDSRVTTHPVEMPVASTTQFAQLFDAITYNKGGSALHQLRYRVGPDDYRRGVSAYLKDHAWGTTTLDDFIRHQGAAAGTDLTTWSNNWLMKPGFNTLAAEPVCQDGTVQSVIVTQTAPAEWPFLRTHYTQLALYGFDTGQKLVVTGELPIVIDGARKEFEIAADAPCPALLNPNYGDWTYAKIAISDSDTALLSEHLAAIEDPLSRSMFLQSLYDKSMTGGMPLADYVRLALRLAENEQSFRVLEQITKTLAASIHMMQRLRPDTSETLPRLLDDVEVQSLKQAHFAESQDLKQLWFKLFLDVASSDAALGTSRALLDGRTDIEGLAMSPDIRWQLLTVLSKGNAPGVNALLQKEIASDPSDLGQRSLLTAQAAAPDLANKQYWVDELQVPVTVTNLARQRAVMAQLFPATQTALQLQLLTRILSALPQMSREADTYFLSSYTASLLKPMCTRESSALMQTALDEFHAGLHPTVLKFLREAHQADVECEALRDSQ